MTVLSSYHNLLIFPTDTVEIISFMFGPVSWNQHLLQKQQ